MFLKEKRVLKWNIQKTHCNHPQSQSADSQWSWQLSLTLLPSWERDRNWRGTQSNLQVSTASDPDAEWRQDALSLFTGHGSSLVSGTTRSSQSHTGAQCLTTEVLFHSCYSHLLFISQPQTTTLTSGGAPVPNPRAGMKWPSLSFTLWLLGSIACFSSE